MTNDRRMEQARSFGAAAAQYERGRPTYPAAALDWLLPAGARRVLDLGAGTGKLTSALVERGLEVVAVEPLEGMREILAQQVPGAQVMAGRAEAIPLGSRSVDVVLAAQAWHWVDAAVATPEVARVLVPGGRLGLVWNSGTMHLHYRVRQAPFYTAPVERLVLNKGERMKTMTCKQLGGPCDFELRGSTADEVIKLQDKHLKDVVAGGDEAHKGALGEMKGRWKHPLAGMTWYRNAKRDFAALPEG